VEYDVIVRNAPCKNVAAFCSHLHGLGPAALDDFQDRVLACWWRGSATPAAPAPAAPDDNLRAWVEKTTELRHGGCAACALPRLLAAGISTFKIAGRGLPTAQKVNEIEFIHEARGLAAQGLPPDRFASAVADLHARRFGRGCQPEDCFYAR
jgi:putative protease